jgi:CYTH domain-containing protein
MSSYLDGMELLEGKPFPEIRKERLELGIMGNGWIFDEYLGVKTGGLITAEVQLPLGERFHFPEELKSLCVREITDNPQFYHDALAVKGLPELCSF